jgi:hypothetical protein
VGDDLESRSDFARSEDVEVGAALNIATFRKRRDLNRGWSPGAKLLRKMERYVPDRLNGGMATRDAGPYAAPHTDLS